MGKTGLQEVINNNEKSPFISALNKAMALCASREYCSNDIRNKLNSWGLSSSDSARVINKLIGEKFLDDKRYAEAFVKDRYRQNKWGRIKIAAQLKVKGIEQNLIDEALSVLDEDEYKQSIKELLISHRRHIKAKNQYDLKGKLMRFGLSKGFESHILYDIINELD